MATTKLYLDKRTSKVKVCIRNCNTTSYISTGFSADPNLWDDKEPHRSMSKADCAIVQKLYFDISSAVCSICGMKSSLTANEIRKRVVETLWGDEEDKGNDKRFLSWFRHYVALKTKPKTIESFNYTIDMVERFDKNADLLEFEHITKDWLTRFSNWLLQSRKVNTVAIHLENIRAVVNDAIDNGLTENYPFRKFKIKREKAEKRAIPIGKLRELFAFKGDETQNYYLDIFKLMFYLCGINMKDLFELKKSNVYDGRLEYRRSKTGHQFSILIQPEAEEIIDRYKGKDENLVHIADRYINYNDFLSRMNKNLKGIGTYRREGLGGKKVDRKPIVEGLSTYYARHSWASVAASLDIPMEIISQALGHEFGLDVTNRYVTFDMSKVDKANRRVIDYVLEK